jgi:hypothetical protein
LMLTNITINRSYSIGSTSQLRSIIMQVLLHAGYGTEELWRLNRVRVSMQLLFMSDVLTASGNKISLEVLSCRPRGEVWSRMQWPNKQPTTSDMELWKNAMHSICPSQCSNTGVRQFIGQTHQVWKWYWNTNESTLHCTNGNSSSEDVFAAGRKPNCFHYFHSQSCEHINTVCSVQPTLERTLAAPFHSSNSRCQPHSNNVPRGIGIVGKYVAVGQYMSVLGGTEWIHQSILDGSLVAVTDDSYIRELYPHLCSAVFVLECGKSQGRVIGLFSESLAIAKCISRRTFRPHGYSSLAT